MPETDEFAKGMASYSGAESESTPTYDRWQYGLFRKLLRGRVLELGAGCGRIAELVVADGNFEQFVATEPSSHFFPLLKARIPSRANVEFCQATSAELIGRYSNYFDSVFSVHVLEHIEDDLAALQQQVALTKPGGAVIVLVPAIQYLYSDLDRNIGHYRWYSKGDFHKLQLAGLPDCRIEKLFYSNALGVLGSLYFSKIRKMTYQGSEENRANFARLYQFFSERVVPVIAAVESRIPVPLGLNLTCVLRKASKQE